MLCELIDMFSPHGGTVLDLMAGTMTSGIAGIQTGRKICCIEKEKDLYGDAIERIRKFIPPPMHRDVLQRLNGSDSSILHTKTLTNIVTDSFIHDRKNENEKSIESAVQKSPEKPIIRSPSTSAASLLLNLTSPSESDAHSSEDQQIVKRRRVSS